VRIKLKGALMMNKNVMIPLSLLNQIIDLLKRWDIPEYRPELRYDYEDVIWALIVKKQKLKLRDAYAKIVQADNQLAKDEAYSHYLQEKNLLDEAWENIPF
jgi:hypothetical protein